MTRTFIALTIGSALALSTLSAFAHEHAEHADHRGMHGMHGNPLEHLTKELDLTADQQAKVSPIVDQAKPQLQAIHKEAMQKARAVIESATAQIRPLLTPQQQTKFDAIQKAQADKMAADKEMREAQQPQEK